MNDEQKVSILAHPFIAALFPGGCALAISLVTAVSGSVMGYQFVHLIVPVENPDADLTYPVAFNLAISWVFFFVCLLAGLVVMWFYRRNLRKHRALLVQRVLISKGEKKHWLPVRQFLAIEWPIVILVLGCVGLAEYFGDTAQGGAIMFSATGGLMASLITTYGERKRIYEDAVQASSNFDAIAPRLLQYAPFL